MARSNIRSQVIVNLDLDLDLDVALDLDVHKHLTLNILHHYLSKYTIDKQEHFQSPIHFMGPY